MKAKKPFIISLLCTVMFFAFSLAVAACTNKKPKETYKDYGENGYYYFDATGEEYQLSLDEGDVSLLIDNETKNGTYKYDGESMVITFADETDTATASLASNVLTVEYNGNTYRFYKRINYKVTYAVDGGSEVAESTVVNGKTLAKPADPTKDGYNFIGWYEDEEFTTPYAFGSKPVTDNMTLYARFAEAKSGQNEYLVEFELGYDGAADYAAKSTVGGVVYDLPTPEREGYKFVGWWVSDYQDGDKLTYQYTNQTLSENTTLYAVWNTGAPNVSVTSAGVSWSADGVNNSYSVKITAPDGTSVSQNGSQTTYTYDFTTKAAGEYKVEVTLNGKTTTVYYNNKGLARVSLFQVAEPSVLIFNAVENAERYYITIDCGNDSHQHTRFDNGNSTNFNFVNCEMQEGGISFRVEAVATGYVSSVSEEFTYSRDLAMVTGLKVNAEKDLVTWNAVENATSYVLEIIQGETTDTVEVGSVTSYDLKAYVGELTVKVYPVAKGYNAPAAAVVDYTKTRLAMPANIAVSGNVVTWDAVNGATKYNVKIGSQVFETTEATYTLPEGLSVYEVSVQAIGNTDAEISMYSEVLTVRYNTMGMTLTYKAGIVSWDYVVDAYRYGVSVNGGREHSIESGVNSFEVPLVASGLNTISVRYYDKYEQESEAATIEVYAKAITFDVRGGKALDKTVVYKAVGDKIELPETTLTGYDFAGWYNVPGGATNNGALYADEFFGESSDITLYAYWTSKAFTITFEVLEEEGTPEAENAVVYYKEGYKLPTATSKDGGKAFGGWYSEPNGKGIAYTDPEGNSLAPWVGLEDATMYPDWIDALSYVLINNGEAYQAIKGAAINYVTEVTVPAYYNDKPVLEIGSFKSASKLRVINIPDTITNVEFGIDGGYGTGSAFQYCSSLEEVNVYCADPDNHEKHLVENKDGSKSTVYESVDGMLLYNNNTNLENADYKELKYVPPTRTGVVRIPEGVQILPINVLKSTKISEVYIPASVTKIETSAFYSCSSLEKVVFEAAAEGETAAPLTIGVTAFKACTSLKEITLPARLANIDLSNSSSANTFTGCTALENIYIEPAEDAKYVSVEGTICTKDENNIMTLAYCPAGKSGSFTIPIGVTKIGESAFSMNTQLTDITIPGYVSEIGKAAFKSRTAITSIVIEERGVELKIGEAAFQSCRMTEIIIPARVTEIGVDAFRSCSSLQTLTFMGTKESAALAIRSGAFYSCSSLTEITLPANLKVLEANAFGSTSNLTKVNVYAIGDNDGENLSLANDAFATTSTTGTGSTYVTNLYLGAEVGVLDFAGIFGKMIANVEIHPDNPNYSAVDGVLFDKEITKIIYYPAGKTGAFSFPTTITEIGASVFEGKNNITSITIGKNIKLIGESAFASCTALTELIFEDGTEPLVISKSAFYGCTGLTTFKLPGRLTTIGEMAFQGCTNLASVALPDNVTEMGDAAFKGCKLMTSVTLSKGLKKISTSAFEGCNVLAAVEIPEGVTEICDRAFYQCYALEKLTISNTVEKIGESAFYYCNKALTEINIPGNVKEIGVKAFYYCSVATSIILGEGIQTIGDYAFQSCAALTNTTIPASVTKMGEYDANGNLTAINVFTSCTKLQKINVAEGNTVFGSKDGVLYGKNSDNELTELYLSPSQNSGKLEIPATVTKVWANAFKSNKGITEINFLSDANDATRTVEFGDQVFYQSEALEKVILPRGLQELPTQLFYKITKLKEVTIPNTVTLINNKAFEDCGALENIIFEEGIFTTTDESTGAVTVTNPLVIADASSTTYAPFKQLSSLKVLSFPERTVTLGKYMFYYCNALNTVNIPASVNKVQSYAFSSCTGLTTVNFADNSKLTSTGTYMFNGCTALTTVTLPNGLKTIDNYTFTGCTKLTSITLPESVETIGTSAFNGCTALTSVTLNEGLKTIGGTAFQTCKKLGAIEIPASVTSIGANAFKDCLNLTAITFAKNAEQKTNLSSVGQYAFMNTGISYFEFPESTDTDGITLSTFLFSGCRSLTKVYLSASVKAIDGVFTAAPSIVDVDIAENHPTFTLNEDQGYVLGDNGQSIKYIYGDLSGTLTLPETFTSIGERAFVGQEIKEIVIPAAVQSIGAYAFQNCTSLERVIIVDEAGSGNPSVLQSIGNYAFAGCSSLKSIVFPNSVVSIGTYAFNNCSSLESVTLPNVTEGNAQFTKIDNYTFKNCTSLTTLAIPSSVTTIGTDAFRGSGLVDITVPESVNSIGNYAFAECPSLKTLQFLCVPDTLGDYLFSKCEALESVVLNDNLTKLSSRNMFHTTSSLKTIKTNNPDNPGEDGKVTLPSKMTDMGTYTFVNSGIEYVSIPEGVTQLGNPTTANGSYTASTLGSVFNGCASLKSVVFLGDKVTRIGAYTFYGTTSLESIVLPSSLTLLGNYAFQNSGVKSVTFSSNISTLGTYIFDNCVNLSEVNVKDSGITKFSNYMFRGCTSLKSVELPTTLTDIGTYTFQNSGLESFTAPTSLKNMGTSASLATYVFSGCENLTTVTLHDGFTSIGGRVFENCTSLKNLVNFDGVTLIGTYAFKGCTALETLELSGVKTFGTYAFDGCSELTTVNLPVATTIASYDFQNCSKLTTVSIPAATKVDASAFRYCTALEKIELPKVTTLGSYVFAGCTALSEVTLNDNLTTIGTYMFQECTSLKTIKLPSKLSSIGVYAFQYSGLESISIPAGVMNLGAASSSTVNSAAYQFADCANLHTVTFEANANGVYGIRNLGGFVFKNCTSLKTINLPNSLVQIGNQAFMNTGLETVVLPASLTTVGSQAFASCPNLIGFSVSSDSNFFKASDGILYTAADELVCYPSGLTDRIVTLEEGVSLGSYAFYGCESITSVVLPSTLTEIPDYAFAGCPNLLVIEVPMGVTSIGAYAFQNCALLRELTLPSTLESIGNYAFDGCAAVTAVELGNSLHTIGMYAFRNTALTSIEIPASVEKIDDYAFSYTRKTDADGKVIEDDCSPLKTVILHEGLQFIGLQAFRYSGIESITIPSTVTTIENFAFESCRNLKEVKLLAQSFAGTYLFQNCTSLEKVTLNDNFTALTNYMFKANTALKTVMTTSATNPGEEGKVMLPSALEKLGQYTFQSSGVVHVTIPENITILGAPASTTAPTISTSSYVFAGCEALETVTFRCENLIGVGAYAFQNCISLKSIELPDTVTTVGNYAFSGSGLESFTLPATITTIGSNLFKDCVALANVTLEEGITTVGSYMFSGTTSLKSIDLPDSIATISSYAFQNSGIENIVIPASVPTIPTGCFSGSALKSITLPDALTKIEGSAFADCVSLKTIEIPFGVTSIGTSAFARSGLESIVIPESITTLSSSTFSGCAALKSVTLPDSLTQIQGSCFANCTSLLTIVIPAMADLYSSKIFENWTANQTINFEADEEQAAALDWNANWYEGCAAKVVYGYVAS